MRPTNDPLPAGATVQPSDDERRLRYNLANRMFFRLYQASNLVHKTRTRAVSEFGTTTQQWAVLGALSRDGEGERGLSIKDLMENLLVSRQNLTLVLDRLERQGLIERVQMGEDRRVRVVRLTAGGRETWGRMLDSIRTYYAGALEGFSTEEIYLLARLLDRLKGRLAIL